MEIEEQQIQQETLDYLRGVRDDRIALAIVGQDPFPKHATGIPFSKESWHMQERESSAGFYVLKALGINVDKAKVIFSTPDDLFRALRDQGVVVLNASYFYRADRKDAGVTWAEDLRASRDPDRGILERAEKVILCGAIAQRLERLLGLTAAELRVHPASRNGNNPRGGVAKKWRDQWTVPSLGLLWSNSCVGADKAGLDCCLL
ncbi:MAG: hypothetical protein ABI216_04095 [Devosia sp.]